MAEHRLNLSGPAAYRDAMILAFLAGRKTQVRLPMKPQPSPKFLARGVVRVVPQWPLQDGVRWFMADGLSELVRCPFGAPGDMLWVPETWRCTGGGDWKGIIYRADERQGSHHVAYKGLGLDTLGRLTVPKSLWPKWDHLVYGTRGSTNWRPSSHMPRWASRITLRVTDVQVQWVQEISETDAQAVWALTLEIAR